MWVRRKHGGKRDCKPWHDNRHLIVPPPYFSKGVKGAVFMNKNTQKPKPFPHWNVDIDDAPRNGISFIASLGNGWSVLISEPHNIGPHSYSWYICRHSVPIVRTHRSPFSEDTLIVKAWMYLPYYEGAE